MSLITRIVIGIDYSNFSLAMMEFACLLLSVYMCIAHGCMSILFVLFPLDTYHLDFAFRSVDESAEGSFRVLSVYSVLVD